MAPVWLPRLMVTVRGSIAGLVTAGRARAALPPTRYFHLVVSARALHVYFPWARVAAPWVAVTYALREVKSGKSVLGGSHSRTAGGGVVWLSRFEIITICYTVII